MMIIVLCYFTPGYHLAWYRRDMQVLSTLKSNKQINMISFLIDPSFSMETSTISPDWT